MGNQVALWSENFKRYVRCESVNTVVCNRTEIGPWEIFYVEIDSNGLASFRSYSHYVGYLRANGNGRAITAKECGMNEKFEIQKYHGSE